MDIMQIVADYNARQTPTALCTVIRTSGSVPRRAGSKMLVGAEGQLIAGTIGGGEMESRVIKLAQQCIRDGEVRTGKYQLADPSSGDPGVCGGEAEVFIEPMLTTPTLVIVGAGHVGRAVVHLAKWAGFRVAVLDDRAELCTPEQCPGADVYLPGPLDAALAQLALTPQTYIAMLTRGYPIDVGILPALLKSDVTYIGVIGSQRRWLTAAKALREKGVSNTDLARISAPIGLEIAAETPEEIAISIMAQVIQMRRMKGER
ncbi:MAG: XdhC family protein [Anaerolineae bacterium]|nr:XdhC family protein [Anaerolineae bacterium]